MCGMSAIGGLASIYAGLAAAPIVGTVGMVGGTKLFTSLSHYFAEKEIQVDPNSYKATALKTAKFASLAIAAIVGTAFAALTTAAVLALGIIMIDTTAVTATATAAVYIGTIALGILLESYVVRQVLAS